MSATPSIVVDSVSKRFRMYRERNQSLKATMLRGRRAAYDEFWALRDVSLEIAQGSTFGLIGENGSGKSTLLKCIARILRPDHGEVVVNGSLAALLELGSGFHPELSGRENVYLNGAILGMTESEIASRFDTIVDFSGIRDFIDQPVKNYSSGMYVRLGFSVAINVDPEILLVDEVLAVGDQQFQDRCMEKFADFRRAGKTVVIVSHSMGALRAMCDEAAWLTHGRIAEMGSPGSVVDDYVDGARPDRGRTDGGGVRWGSGEATVTRIAVIGAGGGETTRPRTGDDVTIRVHFTTLKPIDKPVFNLEIQTIGGIQAWAHHSRDGQFLPDRVQGDGSIDLRIPNLALQAGTYDLNASIVDFTTTHTYDFLRGSLRFDVLPCALRESGGIVHLGGAWENLVN